MRCCIPFHPSTKEFALYVITKTYHLPKCVGDKFFFLRGEGVETKSDVAYLRMEAHTN